MKRLGMLSAVMAVIVLLSASAVTGQDKKTKNRQLPQNYGKIGLSDDRCV